MPAMTDARKLDPATQEIVSRTVVNAIRDGMKQTHASKVFGVRVRAANKWAALDKPGGLRGL
jgi:hypothetical protein